MAFTMHSHSGQFCPGHAKDNLEDVVKAAIGLKMTALATTEHMPRTHDQDLYPEEIEAGHTISMLRPRHELYVKEAVRLRGQYKDIIDILIGFEGEWIRPSYADAIRDLLQNPDVDFFLGSVHHVHDIPIDFDKTMYEQAREVAGGSDERLFEDYFDSQFEMLKELSPRIVAHFDLVRLFSDDPNRNLKNIDGVWSRVVRNLKLVVQQGGLLEINSSALRKGLQEPYPAYSVCEEFLRMGGKFTLADDSHGIAQVGLNFKRSIQHLQTVGVQDLYYLHRTEGWEAHSSESRLSIRSVPVGSLKVEAYPSTAAPQ